MKKSKKFIKSNSESDFRHFLRNNKTNIKKLIRAIVSNLNADPFDVAVFDPVNNTYHVPYVDKAEKKRKKLQKKILQCCNSFMD